MVSVWLWIAYIVCDAAVGLGAFLSPQGYKGSLSGPEFMGVLVGDAIIFALVLAMWRGGNWSRIALPLFAGLRLLFLSPYQSIDAVGEAVNVAILMIRYLLLFAAAVTMLMPAANAWFASRRPGS